MFEYSSYEAENKSQYLTPQWQLKHILRPWPLLFKGQGHFDKNGAKIHKYFSYLRYLKWIFTGELVWIVIIAYQTFFPVIQFQKKCYREQFPKIMKVKVKDQKALL